MRWVYAVVLLSTCGCSGEAFTDAGASGASGAPGSGGVASGGVSGASGQSGAGAGGSGALSSGGGAGGSLPSGGAGGVGGVGGGKGGSGGSGGGAGGGGTCLGIPTGATFPFRPLLDNFDRPDTQAIGGAWVGNTAHFAIKGNQLLHMKPGQDSEILFAESACPWQEVFVTLMTVDNTASSIGLQLASQGPINCEQVEVDYVPAKPMVHVTTCSAGTWLEQGAEIPLTAKLANGTKFGARLYANGTVEVFVNDKILDTRKIAGWPHVGKPGKIGLAVWNGNGTAKFDDFGGG